MSAPEIHIRPAVPADIGHIIAFIRELAAYEKLSHECKADPILLEQWLFGPAPRAWVAMAENAGETVGFALYFYNFSTFLTQPGLYIEDVYVRPEYRGQGIGKAMFMHLARQAVAEGCGRLEWWVLDWNEPAIAFYRSLGAEPMDEWTVQRISGEALAKLAG